MAAAYIAACARRRTLGTEVKRFMCTVQSHSSLASVPSTPGWTSNQSLESVAWELAYSYITFEQGMGIMYDKIGVGYSVARRPDPRIADRIIEVLGDSNSVVNIGAGSGSYEPRDRIVVAVEPSAVMIRQRPVGSPPVVQAAAEALPFADGSFDCTLAILTIHHWTSPLRGLGEMRRVARKRVVILTWDQEVWESFWLIREYLPCVRDFDRRRVPAISTIVRALGKCDIQSVPIPHDCVDGFHGSFWRRPAAYLDPQVRSGMSTYALLPRSQYSGGLDRLAEDIRSGEWEEKHRDVLNADNLDLGYRLIIAEQGLDEWPGETR
jgi:SAM-dependent methyltransferase